LGGFAGTGKSTLLGIIADQELRDTRIAYCAYTGKASNVLRKSAALKEGDYVGTIHSLIYDPVIDKFNGQVIGWDLKPELDQDMIVVDEASMLDAKLMDDLESYELPILAVGDHGQLPPVAGKFNLMDDPDIRLEEIHRQAEGNPIILFSAFIRDLGEDALKRLPVGIAREPMKKAFRRDVKNFHKEGRPLEFTALCYKNKTRCGLNATARKALGYEGHPKAGDVVINLKNRKDLIEDGIIFNGMRALIRESNEPVSEHLQFLDVDFVEDDLRVHTLCNSHQFHHPTTFSSYDQLERFSMKVKNWRQAGLLLDYGYAMTTHKAQGSQFTKVGIVPERPVMVDDDTYTRWLYTACTRAVESLVIYE